MSDYTITEALYKHIDNEWVQLLGFSPVAWENVDFTPKRGGLDTGTDRGYVRPFIEAIDTAALGMGCYRTWYLCTVQIVQPRNTNYRHIIQIADEMMRTLKRFTHDNYHFESIRSARGVEEEEWYTRLVLMNFYYDQQ